MKQSQNIPMSTGVLTYALTLLAISMFVLHRGLVGEIGFFVFYGMGSAAIALIGLEVIGFIVHGIGGEL